MTPYQRIMRAANRGTGVRLSAHEVLLLSLDIAIDHAAANDDEDDERGPDTVPSKETDDERIYPCIECGKMRSKAEGGTTFTVCDECWESTKSDPSQPEEDET